ncbi:MAG: type VI secretion system-associated FHA domain protein TagH [Burkholderiaceae bacterium]|nr:type VI secretion system-associated FHA domain protein TagH [Burkholderiaceae bacterium]
MTLVLRGLSLNEEPLSNPLVGRFDDRGGEIGRSDTATFTLPDPERLISRVHARISHAGHAYWIENVSAAGPMLHNGRPLSSGMRVSLGEGDELRIGGYRLTVSFEDDETSATILRGRTTAQAPPAGAGAARGAAPAPVRSPEVSARSAPPAPARSPESAARPSASPNVANLANAANVPNAANVARASAAAPSLRSVEPAAAAPPLRPVEASEPAPVQAPAAPQPTPTVGRPAQGRGAKSARARAQTESSLDAEALWRGFQEGVGVELPLPGGPSPELFSAIGAMLRIAVNGLHRLIAMRAVAKTEMHADLTMIQVRGNNPMKFAPEPAVALKMLLQPPMQGFMSGPAALRDSVIDLQSHQVGVMAGMRAALAAVLERFDPVQLETQLSARSFLDTLMPSNRRAKLWELYIEHARSLRDEAQDDFGRLFGEAFLEAYNAQVRALEAAADEAAAPAAYPAGPKAR